MHLFAFYQIHSLLLACTFIAGDCFYQIIPGEDVTQAMVTPHSFSIQPAFLSCPGSPFEQA
jgi:hypothetical protein